VNRVQARETFVPTVDTIIVGAGPYGLSVAAHLRAANIGFQIIGQPMASWRQHMPIGMALKSEAFASNLSDPEGRYTLQQFRAAQGRPHRPTGIPLAIEEFVDYADWFCQQAVPNIRNATLTRLRQTANGFELALDDGDTLLAKRVILATGHLAFRFVPEVLSQLPSALVTHSAEHRDLSRFAGQDVTIVGCGQSGLETAALLHERGANVRVLARAPAIDWNPDLPQHVSLIGRLRNPEAGLGSGWRNLANSELPRLFHYLPAPMRQRIVAKANGPAGAWWLKDRMIGKVPMLTSQEIVSAAERNGRLQVSVRFGGETAQFSTDHLIAGTGYKVDVSRLPFIGAQLRAGIRTFNAAPVLSSAFESSVPGLYFVGIASALSFGPVMRFVYGAKHAAAILTAHLRTVARAANPAAAIAAVPAAAPRPSTRRRI
jgi:FAD-dependent urate hydroxylase